MNNVKKEIDNKTCYSGFRPIFGVFVLCFSLFLVYSCKTNNQGTQNSIQLEDLIDVTGIVRHLENFEQIAIQNSGHRAAGSNGYNESVNYVREELSGTGYILSEQPFLCRYFQETEIPVVEMTTPTQKAFQWWDEFRTLTYSGSGDVTAEIVFIDPMIPPGAEPNTSEDGCDIGDFTGIDLAGKIAVIQRGTCLYQVKAENAEARGAVAVLIFNEGQEGRTLAWSTRLSRTEKVNIPVLTVSYAIGVELYNLVTSGESVTLHVKVTTHDEWTTTANFLAESPGGSEDQVIVVGAHLDSVTAGPGINDNASGSASILQLARLMADQGYQPVNKIIFAWWGAEEQGLLGSLHYLENLSENNPARLQAIGICLNFDMLASPNYVRGVLDSDQSHTSSGFEQIPAGSAELEATFVDYFGSRGLDIVYGSMKGSDQYSFVLYGIPSCGLFTGAWGIKTQAEYDLFGGTVGQPHDPCFHRSCDITANISQQILLENARAMTFVTEFFCDKVGNFFDDLKAGIKEVRPVTKFPPWTGKPDLYHKDRMLRDVR
jgi:Zn-dependent M28 family amino/carboxypeptidase